MEVLRVLETALLCLQSSPEKRPSMFRVMAFLSKDADVDNISFDAGTGSFSDLCLHMPCVYDEILLLPTSSSTLISRLDQQRSVHHHSNGHTSIQITSFDNGHVPFKIASFDNGHAPFKITSFDNGHVPLKMTSFNNSV